MSFRLEIGQLRSSSWPCHQLAMWLPSSVKYFLRGATSEAVTDSSYHLVSICSEPFQVLVRFHDSSLILVTILQSSFILPILEMEKVKFKNLNCVLTTCMILGNLIKLLRLRLLIWKLEELPVATSKACKDGGRDIERALDTVAHAVDTPRCRVTWLVKSHMARRDKLDFSPGLSSSLNMCEKVLVTQVQSDRWRPFCLPPSWEWEQLPHLSSQSWGFLFLLVSFLDCYLLPHTTLATWEDHRHWTEFLSS